MLIDSSGQRFTCALGDENGIADFGGAGISARDGWRPGMPTPPDGPTLEAAVSAALADLAMPLTAIAVGVGPGSFIGTRSAISFANGYAAAAAVPLFPVNSLAAIAAVHGPDCAVLRDARRGQWYCWTPDGECSAGGEQSVIELLHGKCIERVVVEWASQAETSDGPPSSLAALLKRADIELAYAPGVPAEGLLRQMDLGRPRRYVEPVYLRGFT